MSLLVFRLPVKVYRAAFTPRLLPHIRVASSSHPFIISTRAMGGGGSKEEGGGKKKSTRKSKETVSVATTVQSEVAAEKEGGTVSSDEYIECKVAKASEFGENE